MTPAERIAEHRGDVEAATEAGYFAERADSSLTLGEVVAEESARWRSFAEMYPEDDA